MINIPKEWIEAALYLLVVVIVVTLFLSNPWQNPSAGSREGRQQTRQEEPITQNAPNQSNHTWEEVEAVKYHAIENLNEVDRLLN